MKFATQVDEKALEDLRAYADQSGQSISKVVNDAIVAHLSRIKLRPVFLSAAEEVLAEHSEVLNRLAK